MGKILNTKQIDKDTLALLQSVYGPVGTIKLPVDLNGIAANCGLAIRQGRFLDPRIEGALDRTSGTIFLSEKDNFEDKNFTLAHEIGHYQLHKYREKDVFTMHQVEGLLERQGKDIVEDQADYYAASLLMPKKSVIELWEASDKNLRIISKIFGVPLKVATYRLRGLGLIS